jgi:hypothetical protein
MQMIDVMKRLAELDADNKNVVKESTNIEECGMMPMPGMGGSHTPASINMTADSGSELTGMLRDIMQLAGMNKVEPEHLGVDHAPMSISAEPVSAVGPAIAEPLSGADSMRSVLDKLNPEPENDDSGSELGPFQGDSDSQDDVSVSHGDVDNDGDHDMDDHDAEDDDAKKVDEYDNTPSDPNSAEPFDANQFSNQENQPGSGNTSDGKKRQSNLPTATFEALMKDYKAFIGESEEATDEGIMDKAKEFGKKVLDKVGHGDDEEMIKDLQKKAGVPQTGKKPEPTKESADILKLAGLK